MDLGQLSLGPYECLLPCMSPQLALPGTTGAAAIRPDGPNGRVADSLDEAKAAFRAGGNGALEVRPAESPPASAFF